MPYVTPSSVDIFDRTGKHRFTLGDEFQQSTRFGIGVTNLHFQDPMTDKVVPFVQLTRHPLDYEAYSEQSVTF